MKEKNLAQYWADGRLARGESGGGVKREKERRWKGWGNGPRDWAAKKRKIIAQNEEGRKAGERTNGLRKKIKKNMPAVGELRNEYNSFPSLDVVLNINKGQSIDTIYNPTLLAVQTDRVTKTATRVDKGKGIMIEVGAHTLLMFPDIGTDSDEDSFEDDSSFNYEEDEDLDDGSMNDKDDSNYSVVDEDELLSIIVRMRYIDLKFWIELPNLPSLMLPPILKKRGRPPKDRRRGWDEGRKRKSLATVRCKNYKELGHNSAGCPLSGKKLGMRKLRLKSKNKKDRQRKQVVIYEVRPSRSQAHNSDNYRPKEVHQTAAASSSKIKGQEAKNSSSKHIPFFLCPQQESTTVYTTIVWPHESDLEIRYSISDGPYIWDSEPFILNVGETRSLYSHP
ncbi:hypothetical protein Cgig2_008725 [Carnegiea gigantea]|uniref:Uncharacterized protein n=1 Tax=Carnegiea gigantea TaxID=171969 RepID=A0A9Q1QGZ0_9CARY|nr:hypothetical protein Cgig2_008725 [Carnegiea gigantea]